MKQKLLAATIESYLGKQLNLFPKAKFYPIIVSFVEVLLTCPKHTH